jgi:Mg-chelatase subunit ChlD
VLEATLTDKFDVLRSTALSASNLTASRYTGWTGTGAALGDAAHYLKYGAAARKNVQRVIVLMSDGHANRPSSNGPGYARTMAAYAAGNEVKVYTISLGNDADVTLMSDIATITGGEHFDATGSGEAQLTDRLSEAFRRAAATIKRAQLVN